MTYARYCWLKHDAALRRGERAVASAWKTKALEAELAEQPLPAAVPYRAQLLASHFFAADLAAADLDDLAEAGLTERAARAVLASLPPPL